MTNQSPSNNNTNYHPLLPKTTQNFPGGNAPGEWNVEGVPLFNRIGNSLDFEAGNYNEVNSIPSPWSKSLQFISAMRNSKYPSRQWLIDQYRGILAAIALSENLNLPLQAVRINLQNFQNNEFGRCLWKLQPSAADNILATTLEGGPWSQLYLFELEGAAIAFTSPATLIVPVGYLKPVVENRIPWVKNGFFTDPISNGLTPTQKALLAPWLQHLRSQLLNAPVNRTLAGEVAAELEKFQQALGVAQLAIFEPSERPVPFGEPLAPAPLEAFKPAKMVKQESNVKVLCSTGLTPAKQLYLIDPLQLPALMGRDAREINVIDSSSLSNFDPNLHRRSDALFLSPGELFTEKLFYVKTKGLLPGTWLDRKLNVENLSILLPLNPILKDYFGSQDLEANVQLDACNTADGPGVRVTLGLKLSGFAQPLNYQVYKDFSLKAENEITQAFPTLALWPNVPPSNWREYFVFIEISEGFGGLAFGIEQPTDKATQETRQSGQEKYRYWKCDRYPEILSAINKDGQFLGLLPLNIPQTQSSSVGTWTVGVDFGTSLTNFYVRKGNGQPERFNSQTNLLRITKGLETEEAITYREFFVPDTFIPEGNNPPLSTILTTRGGQEREAQVPDIISHARIYVPRLDKFDFAQEHIKTNIKWQQIQYQRPFLSQLLRLISAQAAREGVYTIEWAYSYPSAFSSGDEERYDVVWQQLIKELAQISGQAHRPVTNNSLRTESVAFAQFFGDVLGENLVHTTCVDIGGGTSDISIWVKNCLIHQASVSYAGRDIFHQILKPNFAFVGEIFGLSSEDAASVSKLIDPRNNNFNSALDTYLRGNADQILGNGYVMNADKPRSREFRTLLAFAVGGLYHYLGLIQNYLHQQDESFKDVENSTSILIGGNGSRFFNWLTTSGRYGAKSEINILLREIVARASGLKPNPNLMSLSPQPKDEACGGLVVLPDGEKLTGWQGKRKNDPFLGETCMLNGQVFQANQRLEIKKDWETIDDFQITSFDQLERYLESFNAIISEQDIQQIGELRNFDKGGLFTLTDDLRTLLKTSVTQVCLRKIGSARNFEREPAFLLILRCFIGILAKEWSKTAN